MICIDQQEVFYKKNAGAKCICVLFTNAVKVNVAAFVLFTISCLTERGSVCYYKPIHKASRRLLL